MMIAVVTNANANPEDLMMMMLKKRHFEMEVADAVKHS